jgi:hypothetical protein
VWNHETARRASWHTGQQSVRILTRLYAIVNGYVHLMDSYCPIKRILPYLFVLQVLMRSVCETACSSLMDKRRFLWGKIIIFLLSKLTPFDAPNENERIRPRWSNVLVMAKKVSR